jgi:hypothetical protein
MILALQLAAWRNPHAIVMVAIGLADLLVVCGVSWLVVQGVRAIL